MKFTAGTIVGGNFRLLDQLGSGGFGVVWRAEALDGDGLVAVKVLHAQANSEAQRRFEIESKVLGSLRHPNCVRLIHYGIEAGTQYLVLQYVRGTSLTDWLTDAPSMRDRREVAQQLTAGLQAAHRAGILHRDLKPDNVMISRGAEGPHVTLLDFGISRLAGAHPQDITKTGVVNGTPGYMSPEQLFARSVGTASDVYALGIIFYEMFEGKPPFVGDSPMAVALQHTKVPAPPPKLAPPELRPIIAQMLEKAPEARPSLNQVSNALNDSAQAAPQNNPSANSRWFAVAALALAVPGLGVLVLSTFAKEPRVEPPTQKRVSGAALTRPTSPQPQKSATPEPIPAPLKTRPAESVSTAKSIGCGLPIERGLITLVPHSEYPVHAYIPESYSSSVPAPAVWVIHDIGQSGATILRHERYQELAEEKGYVLIAPDDHAPLAHVWSKATDHERLLKSVALAEEFLCIATDQRFYIGHGAGAVPAENVACDDRFVAVARVSHRESTDTNLCNTSAPSISINTSDDKSQPVSGVDPCLSNINIKGNKIKSLKEHERLLAMAHHCSGASTDVDSICRTWKCKSDFVSCVVPGGRFLPDVPPTTAVGLNALMVDCGGFISESPADRIWAFFEEQLRNRDRK